MLQYLVFVSVGVSLFGISAYIKDTLKGKNKPNRMTWFIWAIVPLIATAAAISDGVTLAVIPVFMAGFGPLLVFLSSFINKNSYWKLSKFDYVCGSTAILALVLWYITDNPNIAIIFAIISDAFAALPTIIKSFKHPETESPEPYFTGLFSAITSFFAIKTFKFSEIAFPIYLVIIILTLIGSIYIGRYKQKK